MTVDIIPTVVPDERGSLDIAAQTVLPFTHKLHIDIDDGQFTPQVSWPYTRVGEYAPSDVNLPEGIEASTHLMVRDPRQLGLDLIRAHARSVVAHVEACESVDDAQGILTVWRAAGAREVGLSILLDTPLIDIERVAEWCDVIQVMSVAAIGAQGAPFDSRAVERVRALHEKYPHVTVAVDGGVNVSNAAQLVAAGATRLCVGKAVMHADDPAEAYRLLSAATG